MTGAFLVENGLVDSEKQAKRPEPPDHAGVAFHPPLLLGLAFVVGFVARWLVPLAFLPSELSTFAGPVSTAGSFALFFWAAYTMHTGKASIPTGEPTDAIVGGQ